MNIQEFEQLLADDAKKYAEDPKHVRVLFHGTNRNALQLAEEERGRLKDTCELIIRYFLDAFSENGVGQLLGHRDELGEDFLRLSNAYTAARARNNNVGLYDYNSTYLTFDYGVACSYAKRAKVFGETGYIIVCLYEAYNKLGFKPIEMTEKVKKAFAYFTERMGIPDEPVVMAYFGVDVNNLLMEKGSPLTFHGGGVRVVGSFDLTNGIAITSLTDE